MPGPEHMQRMRIKSHNHSRPVASPGLFDHLMNDLLMTAMQTIKDADGYDRMRILFFDLT